MVTDDGTDRAHSTFVQLFDELQSALTTAPTEQDVRLKIIDRILTTVLNWPHTAISTNVHNGSGFADYTLTDSHGRTLAILEAKKTGELHINTASLASLHVKLSGPVLKDAQEGIKQAVTYCTNLGTSYATVTDGKAWIFFRATRQDGLAPKDGHAIIFPTLQSIADDFSLFYELLSASALPKRLHLFRLNAVEGLHARPAEPTFFINDPAQARLVQQTDLGRDVADVFHRFFAGMNDEHDSEMRRKCFAETKESREADATLTKITQHLTNAITTIETEGSQALRREIQTVIDSQISEICLLVGNKGVGKSTFVLRFFEDVLPAEIRKVCLVATIDLEKYVRDEKSIQQWLAEHLRDQLENSLFSGSAPTYEDYQGMFFRVYQRWSEATHRYLYENDKDAFKEKFGEYVETRREENPAEYAIGLMHHAVAARRLLPCIVFDNTDQFSLEIQEKVFQFAVGLKTNCVSFIIIPITDRSIWRLSKAGAFQSYQSRHFYLPAPAPKEVLTKRVQFIQQKLEAQDAQRGAYFLNKGIRVSIKNLTAFVQVLEEAFINNSSIASLIGKLANYNVRQMMLLAQRIITSPAFKIEELISIFLNTQRRVFQYHRTIRSLLQGSHDRHSNTSNDFVQNLFATDGRKPTTPLLLLSILTLLSARKILAEENFERTYATLSELINYFEPCQVSAEEVQEALTQLLSYRSIEPFDPNSDAIADELKVAITENGDAHLESV